MGNYFERYHAPRQPAPLRPIIEDPIEETRLPQAREELRGQGLQNAKNEMDLKFEPRRLAVSEQGAATEREKQAAAIAAAKFEREQGIARLRALDNQIGRVADLYRKGAGSTSGISGLMDYLPTETNKQVDTAGAGLAEMALGAFRTPGVGAQSDKELQAFIEANRPYSSDYDVKFKEKIRNIENRLANSYAPYGVKYRPRDLDGAPRKGDVDHILKKYGVE